MFFAMLLLASNTCPPFSFGFRDTEDHWEWEQRVEKVYHSLSSHEKLRVVWRGPRPLIRHQPPATAQFVVLQRSNCETLELQTDAGHWSDRPGAPKDKWNDTRYPVGSTIEVCRVRWRFSPGNDVIRAHLFGAEVETSLQRIFDACGGP